MAFTVTATESGASASHGVALLVQVFTNATESGGASSGSDTTSPGVAAQGSLTPNFSGSYVAFSVSGDNVTSMPAAATGNTYDFTNGNPSDVWSTAQGHYSGTVTASSALTYGAGSGTGQDHANWCAYEVPASGGTITLDGSSPAGVLSGASLVSGTAATTASFTPPVGSVLVAEVCAGGSGAGAGITMTITDTSGLGLTWTQQAVSSSSDNFQPTFIFTTTVPAPPASIPPSYPTQPLPPQWFPGSHRVSAPGGVPFAQLPSPVWVPPPPPAPVSCSGSMAMAPMGTSGSASFPLPYIAGLSGGASGYFVDQHGNPRLYYAGVPWGMPANAGRWNSGNWQLDFDTYFADIAARGMTAAEMHPWGHSHTGCNNDVGNTWDGVSPWTTLPTLNNTFWARIDYLLNSALANGITVLLDLTMQCDMGMDAFAGTGVFNGVSAANIQTACQNIAARYASQPNLIYIFGDDYNNNDDTRMSAALAGLRAGGYTGPITVENFSTGTTSRHDLSLSPTGTPFSFGGSNANFNWCYYYEPTYFAVEQAYKETSQIPVVWGDGFYVGGGATEPNDSHIMRNMVWWALASGARGCSMGSETILNWQSTAFTDLTVNQLWYVNSALAVYTLFASLPGWQNLLPDLTNALVTAGRGTRAAYSNQFFQSSDLGTDNYVAASRAPDGSLAVIYCAVAMSITIDQTKMGAGYTATWVDPANGATQTATVGSTYGSSGLGNNSAGNTDWVLVLQAAVVSGGAALAPMAMSGAATVTAGSSTTSTGSIALAPMAESGTAAEVFTTSGSLALAPLQESGSAQSFSCSGSMALAPMGLGGTAAEVFTTSGSVALAPMGEAGSGIVAAPGSITGSMALPAMGMSGAAQSFGGAGSTALAPMAMSGSATVTGATGVTGSLALAPMGLAGSATETIGCSGSLALAPMTMSGTPPSSTAATGSLALAPMLLHAGQFPRVPNAAFGSLGVLLRRGTLDDNSPRYKGTLTTAAED